MKPTPSQIAGDRHYFETCKAKQSAPIGARFRVLAKPYGVRPQWFRVWERTGRGWKFVGVQQGRWPAGSGENV